MMKIFLIVTFFALLCGANPAFAEDNIIPNEPMVFANVDNTDDLVYQCKIFLAIVNADKEFLLSTNKDFIEITHYGSFCRGYFSGSFDSYVLMNSTKNVERCNLAYRVNDLIQAFVDWYTENQPSSSQMTPAVALPLVFNKVLDCKNAEVKNAQP